MFKAESMGIFCHLTPPVSATPHSATIRQRSHQHLGDQEQSQRRLERIAGHSGAEVLEGAQMGSLAGAQEVWAQVWWVLEPLAQIWEVAAE